ncbi:probable gluconokinase isoform X3 [Sapajus apella]|uniref:gluconokinase n=1 Tax=Sapajus apella TaxID=9515 RepID=A0A6J3IXB9_SAPAP|nr:probable gluconokinase isoform X3 [Sapajus apella]
MAAFHHRQQRTELDQLKHHNLQGSIGHFENFKSGTPHVVARVVRCMLKTYSRSTVGALLASELGWKFYDADDYHSEENRRKMGEGIPLNDQDRIPWLCKLHDILLSCDNQESLRSLVSEQRCSLGTACGSSLFSPEENVQRHINTRKRWCSSEVQGVGKGSKVG